MGKSWSIFIAGIALGVLLATGGFAWFVRQHPGDSSPSRAAVRVLKLAHGLDSTHPVHVAMEYMAQRLWEISTGAMRLEIYPSGVLGSETECLEQLQNGVLDMTKTSSAPMESFIPEMQVFGLPYLFRDEIHFWTVLEGPIGRRLLQQGQDKHLYGLCYYDAGSRNFYNTKRPIRTPADLRGLKIRVQNSPVAMKMVKALGGAPTPISWGELYTALAQGTVDGAENNPPSFMSNKHYEVCKYFSLDAHTRVPDILLISTLVWNTLTPLQQSWLQQAADESSHRQRLLWAQRTTEDLQQARQMGVAIVEPDPAPFIENVQPLYEEYRESAVGSLARQIRAVP